MRLPAQKLAGCQADARTGSGHQCDLSLKPFVHKNSSLCMKGQNDLPPQSALVVFAAYPLHPRSGERPLPSCSHESH